MDALDGILLVPPDRSQILGRASWKPRYVVVGRRNAASKRDRQGSACFSPGVTSGSSSRAKALAQAPSTEGYCISVYKSKDETEPIQQWPATNVADCQVQLVTNRKQGPVLPTLVITITDKERRRRSSRAAGFITANKESGTTTLWFRTPQDDHLPSLHDWARFILAKKSAPSAESPVSPIFTSPFATRSRDSDHNQRPGSGSRALQHKSSSATYSTGPRDLAATISSESPSLRSKRSDISSPSSNNYPPQKLPYAIPEQHYTTVLPSDLGPSTPLADYRGEFIEGWTSAQGRSSTMSSPTRGRDSISSQAQHASIYGAACPPAPGETILDRAFQLGQIPGAESYIPGQEKLSSIARFDALMREVEERRKQNEKGGRVYRAPVRSAFEDDDSSDEAEPDEADDADSASDAQSEEHDDDHGNAPLMSPGAQRALAYIAGPRRDNGRHSVSHRPGMSRAHVSFHAGVDPVSSISPAPPLRPHTAHAKSRPNASRTHSTPHLTTGPALALDVPSSAASGSNKAMPVPGGDKRNSICSTKRLSFTEFTKRLSSSSSLLLVQTNASAGSSRGSSEVDLQPSSAPRTNLTLRGASGARQPSLPLPPRGDRQDRRCGWRGSVVGAEGGFL